MKLTLTTWNINSVRLRIDLVAKFIKAVRPDILCLQETKCPDDAFPLKRFKRLGYENVALNGQKGYHGVVVLSRLPFESIDIQSFCGKSDCRHVSAVFGERAGLRDPITVHNFYVPAGGDIPDPAVNPKFAHKLAFLDEMRDCATLRPAPSERSDPGRRSQRRAARARRLEPQADAARGVAYADRMRETRRGAQKAGGWVDSMRQHTPEPAKLYTWWSYRSPDWATADKGRRLDHIWTSPMLADRVAGIGIARNYRGAERPSDHVPVTATIDVER